MSDSVKTVFFRGKVYLIDLGDLREGETEESVLQKMIAGGSGFSSEEYFRFMHNTEKWIEEVCDFGEMERAGYEQN